MKRILTSTFAIVLSVGLALANGHNDTLKPTSEKIHSNPVAAVSIKALLDENAALRLKLDELQNTHDELQSTVAYSTMMNNMMQQIKEKEQFEKQEELKSEIAYNKMMAAMLLKIREGEK